MKRWETGKIERKMGQRKSKGEREIKRGRKPGLEILIYKSRFIFTGGNGNVMRSPTPLIEWVKKKDVVFLSPIARFWCRG